MNLFKIKIQDAENFSTFIHTLNIEIFCYNTLA